MGLSPTGRGGLAVVSVEAAFHDLDLVGGLGDHLEVAAVDVHALFHPMRAMRTTSEVGIRMRGWGAPGGA